jgi:hypothetical protein
MTPVTGFIRKCIDNVVPTVKVSYFPNQKPWINIEIPVKLKDRADAHEAIVANPEFTVMAKCFENDINIDFHKVCCLSLHDGNLHILQNVMKSD